MAQSSKEVKQRWLKDNHHLRAEINRNWTLRNVYGLTTEQYQAMFDAQDGRCAICKVPFIGIKEEPKNQRVHIDHNHETLWVRGLLCGHCNFGIGHFQNDIDKLQAAIEYLISSATPPEFLFQRVPNPPRGTNSGVVRDAEWRQNISASKKGKSPAWNKGIPWSDEVKVQMSQSAISRWNKET